jgi:hypothetical protein
MSDVGEIMREFTQAFRRDPAADPREFLERVEGTDREELRLLIEGFLTQAPRQKWDLDAFVGSMADRAMAAAGPPAAAWPKLLPELRQRARLSRATVVARLAAALGFPEDEARVASYYHRMELGGLSPMGVSTRVLERLGEIVGVSAASLREAGRLGEAGSGSGGEVFARVGSPLADASSAETSIASESDRVDDADALDLLFTGGD